MPSARSARSPKSSSPAPRRRTSKRATKPQGPPILPVIPLRGMVAFPEMVLPLFIGREKSVAAIEAAAQGDKLIFLCAQREEDSDDPGADDVYAVGVVGEIMQWMKLPDGNLRVVVEGRARARAVEYPIFEPFFGAILEPIEEAETPDDARAQALLRRLKDEFENAVNLSKKIPPEAVENARENEKLGACADLVASFLDLSVADRQLVLEESDPQKRAEKVVSLLASEIGVLEIEREIEAQVKEGVSENQREYFLRERLKSIQEKLGERDPNFGESSLLREKIEAAGMPAEVREKALKELDRLERMPPIAPEVASIRSYVELMSELPWDKTSGDEIDLIKAQEILDADHYALGKVKERILEFLAVRKLNPNSRGPILCFMGPPGVGKTSIGKSIAKALGREFVRISVGGVHDEAEIRGHRRTYIGSMPGRIIAALRRCKVKNPVFLLDEIDKIGHDYRGDPSSALLEALDPEQNSTFTDHYLEVPFDLSQVMFIATGNQLDPIQPALRDRMETLQFGGYTDGEKRAIATGFLIPKQLGENGIETKHLQFEESGLSEIIRGYTREAGVRNLEREIGNVCRKVARQVAAHAGGRFKKVKITSQNVKEFLGARRFSKDLAFENDEIGVAQGLAWTEVGGEVLPIEVLLTKGVGAVKMTGNLGQVMKESAEAALTYARAHADELGISSEFAALHDAHIHVPAGAVPKDGPSAGVAMTVALVSAMAARPARKEVAMTGEISLRGHVLPVGGVKEKVLAAHRNGAMEVILPRENERDLEELPGEVKASLKFHLVERVQDAVSIALYPMEKKAAALSDPQISDEDKKLIEKSQAEPEPEGDDEDEFEIPKLSVETLDVEAIETGELKVVEKKSRAKSASKKARKPR